MKLDTISLRRRHLLIAGAAAPAALFAAQCGAAGHALATGSSVTAGGADKLVVSGRILGASGKPLAGALVEALYAGANEGIGVRTDADGRFVLESATASRLTVDYRISNKGSPAQVSRLDAAQLLRDEAGTWRGTFGLTLA